MFITHEKLLNTILNYLLREKEIIPSIFTQKIVSYLSKEIEKEMESESLELMEIIIKSRISVVCEILKQYTILTKVDDDCFRITESGIDIIWKYNGYISIMNDVRKCMFNNLSAETKLIRQY